MHQAGELPETLRASKIHYEPPQTVCKEHFASIFPPSMENGDGTRLHLAMAKMTDEEKARAQHLVDHLDSLDALSRTI